MTLDLRTHNVLVQRQDGSLQHFSNTACALHSVALNPASKVVLEHETIGGPAAIKAWNQIAARQSRQIR